MNTITIPEKTAPATTLFEFTEDEVKDALSSYIVSRGGLVPDGERDVWADDEHSIHVRTLFFVRMRVTHDQPAHEPEKGKRIRATCYEAISDAVNPICQNPVRLRDAERSRDDVFRAIDAALDSTRADTVREYSELLRKNCPHLCTDFHEAAKTARYIRDEMGVST